MAVRVKICGLTRADEARSAVDAGADAVGMVFVPGTPREVSLEQAAAVAAVLPPFVARVGLFVDAPAAWVRDVVERLGLDTVQFHGSESPEDCAAFRPRVRVLKAFRVRGPATLEGLGAYREVTDAWLLDAYVPGVAGGTGATFDWALARRAVAMGHPVILAGGLDAENVAGAIAGVEPFAVDVSSGVESAPGRKDAARMRAFCEAVRGIRR